MILVLQNATKSLLQKVCKFNLIPFIFRNVDSDKK